MSIQSRIGRRQLVAAVAATALGGYALTQGGRPRARAGEEIPTPGPTNGPLGGERFLEALSLAPDLTKGNFLEPQILFSYADLEGQLEAVGVEPAPTPLAEQEDFGDYLNALFNLPIADPVGTYARSEEWYPANGFDLTEVSQTIQLGEPPSQVTIVRGDFDLERITEALTGQGYTVESVSGVDVLNGGDDFDQDLERDVSRFWLGKGQNFALVDERTLVVAGSTELIELSLAAIQGDGTAVSDVASIRALVPDELESVAGALVVTGTSFVGGMDPAIALDPEVNEATLEAVEQEIAERESLPPIRVGMLCTTFGGPLPSGPDDPEPTVAPGAPVAQAQIRALFGSREDAEAALPIVTERLETGTSLKEQRPWSEVLRGWALDVVGDEGLLVIRLGLPGNAARRVFNLLYDRNLGFISL